MFSNSCSIIVFFFSRSLLVSQEAWKQSSTLLETLLGVRKLAVRQVDLPFQPSSFFDTLPEPEPEPEMCSYSFLFLRDILSDREFLVDWGASVSVFQGPKSDSSAGVRLLAADGSPMICNGTKIIPLKFSCGAGSKVYAWTFQLAPVSVPLLRADFLENFKFSSTSKDIRWFTLSARRMSSLHLSYSSACLPPCILPLCSASDPETSL